MSKEKDDEPRIDKTNEGKKIVPLTMYNEAELIAAAEATRDLTTSEFEQLCQGVTDAFEEHSRSVENQYAAMPSKISQGAVNRLQNQILIDAAGIQLCALDTINWGQSYVWQKETRRKFKIHKMDVPGGSGVTVEMQDGESHDLGTPTVYSSEMFKIPRFDKYFPDKWVRKFRSTLSDVAADMTDKLDNDTWTIIDTQLTSSDDLDDLGFSYYQPRVKNLPSNNDINLSSEAGLTKQFIQEVILHGIRMKRRPTQIFVPPPAMEGIWDWVDENTYAPRISDGLLAYVERTGGAALTVWGYTLAFIPVNTLEGMTGSRYVYVKYEPAASASPDAVPPGAAFFVRAQPPAGSHISLDYMGPTAQGGLTGGGGGIFEQYVVTQGALIVGIDYQMPNLARFRYV